MKAIVAALLALALSVDVAGAAPVLCQRKSQLKIRDGACKARETQVTLADLGVYGRSEADGTFAAASHDHDGRYYTKAEVDFFLASLTGTNIVDRGLTLSELGDGTPGERTTSVTTPITLAAGSCRAALAGSFGEQAVGSLVIGTLTDADGDAVLPSSAAVMPAVVIRSTQGDPVPNLVVCNTGSSVLTIPVGSVFHWRLISP
jgi:hypothetical protein